jgi:transcriptional regulator with XRE-family HTH domain
VGLDVVFRRRLRQLVKQRYGSIDRMYLETGLSKGHIADLMRGKHSPSLRIVEQLAKALEVSPLELLSEAPRAK